MASRGERGGLAAAAGDAMVVLEAAGRDLILLETMGVGQDEVEVARLADVTVLVLVPGMGDAVQSLKAGIMEVADVYVVNKADQGGAERVEAEILAMQGLGEVGTAESRRWVAPVVRTSAVTGEGVEELVGVISEVGRLRGPAGSGRLLPQTRPTLDAAEAAPKTGHPVLAELARGFGGEGEEIQGSLRCATDDEAVRRFGRDDVFPLREDAISGASAGLRLAAAAAAGMGEAGLRLDHLGVAVRSIAAARGFYEGLGLRVGAEETVEGEGVRVAMVPVGEAGGVRIELMEPVGEESVVGRFLARRGEGLHHIALRSEDLEGTFRRLGERGVRLVSERIGVGAGGHRYFFVHPASTGGVLVEMVAD